jgi:hydrogenase small subunit
MISIGRRELFKLIAVSASGAALLKAMEGMAEALSAQPNRPALVWWNEGGDDLNLLTLLGQAVPRFMELITLQWDLQAHQGVLSTGVENAAKAPANAPILVVERIPPREALEPASQGPLSGLLAGSKAAILLGTEACYGGLSTAPEEVAHFEGLCRQNKTPVIKLPGVPVPPHHLVGVLAHLEFFGFPRLDAEQRPLLYYGETVCTGCELRADLDAGRFAGRFGEEGCLLRLGCKGLITHNSCSFTRWNNGENWCVGAGGACTGCSEPGFPDHGGVGLYGALTGRSQGARSTVWGNLERVGYGLLGLVGAGAVLQGVRRLVFPVPEEDAAAPPSRQETR